MQFSSNYPLCGLPLSGGTGVLERSNPTARCSLTHSLTQFSSITPLILITGPLQDSITQHARDEHDGERMRISLMTGAMLEITTIKTEIVMASAAPSTWT